MAALGALGPDLENFLAAVSILKKGSVVCVIGGDFYREVPKVEQYSSNPLRYWREYLTLHLIARRPRMTHYYFARLQELGIVTAIITADNNGDFQAAGCVHVIGLNGHHDTGICLSCRTKSSLSDSPAHKTPTCRICQGLIIPAMYFSEDKEMLDQALRAVSNCKTLLLMNLDDCTKYPFSLLLRTAKRCGSKLIGIGSKGSDLMDVFLDGDPQLILNRTLQTLEG